MTKYHADKSRPYRHLAPQFGVGVIVAIFSTGVLAASCIADPPPPSDPLDPATSLPLASINNFQFIGGFSLPADDFGQSSLNYAEAVIEAAGNSLFIVGHVQDDAIAEFIIPPLVNTTNIAALPSAGAPVQNFTNVLNRSSTGNTDSIDTITGLEVYNNQLIVNGIEYYDGAGDNDKTTLVLSEAGNLAGSDVRGYLELPGAARIAGWVNEMPPEWQAELGTTHLIGHSSGPPIVSRHSVGPSFHAINAEDLVTAGTGANQIPTEKLLEFSLDTALNTDLYNDSRNNDLWTILSTAKYGFIIPGSRTYATIGYTGGTESGIGYKITQDNGNLCGGPCPYQSKDVYNYYWFWDMNELLEVRSGIRESYEIQPYEYGELNVPFQTDSSGHNSIGGASFDSATSTLYVSVREANNTIDQFANPPVIAAFRVTKP